MTSEVVERDIGGNLLLLIARAASENTENFKRSVLEQSTTLGIGCANVQKLRLSYFQPYQNNAWQAPGVDHEPEQVFDAMVEIRLPTRQLAVSCLQTQSLFSSSHAGVARQRVLKVYPAPQRFTLVAKGRPTQLGLRGLQASELIDKLGAKNQQQRSLLNILYGVN